MPSRQDQLHSYQFTVQRVVAALVMRETDPTQSPFRRAAGATLASVLVAAIALGAVGVYGLIAGGGSDRWRDTSAVIVEKESGARFVYRDERLHPVLNYTSGLLIVGASRPKTVLVSRKSIEGAPRGTALGIPDAPDSLPAADRLLGTPWTVCSGRVTVNGTQVIRSMLLVGREAKGGEPLQNSAVLARSGDNTYLIYRNRRHSIQSRNTVLAALGYTGQRPVTISSRVVNMLEVGTVLDVINIADRGELSPVAPGAKIGQVFVSEPQSGSRQYAVAVADGLAPISQMQADILLSDPRTRDVVGQERPTEMAQSDFASARKLRAITTAGGTAPTVAPKLATTGDTVCVSIEDDTGVVNTRVRATLPAVSDAARTASSSSSGTLLAEYVLIEPGRGAVVRTTAGPGAVDGALCVVTDLGRRYAVPSAEVLGMLGYGDVRPVRLPANLVSLLPAGDALDPESARTPVAAQ
jgi:type VII secretion protein EccB